MGSMGGRKKPLSKKAHRKLAREYVNADMYHWVRRVLGAFKQNAEVQRRVMKGEFDKALEGGKK